MSTSLNKEGRKPVAMVITSIASSDAWQPPYDVSDHQSGSWWGNINMIQFCSMVTKFNSEAINISQQLCSSIM